MSRAAPVLRASLAVPFGVALTLSSGCSDSPNRLYGSASQFYDLSFDSVTIVLQGSSVAVQYIGSGQDPAILVVDTANIVNVSNSTIDLTQLVGDQPRGNLQRVGAVTTALPLQQGTVVFDQVPKVGSTLSGHFAATLAKPAGYTLDGDFSATVIAP
jgi:hypothetical protein